jgi:N-acetylglucosamine-6-sulfatase
VRRRDFLSAAGAVAAGGMTRGATRRAAQPNVVVIVVDDMRFDEFGLGGHPYLQTPHVDALARGGATFRRAYHTTPLCSPNRACILTGQYASRHGITDNTSRSYASHRLRTFARELKSAGYETAHVGKWHMGNDPSPRPGYDTWVSFAGQGRVTDPDLYEDGRLRSVPGYITDLLTDRAVEFVSRKRKRPFMLYLGHKAIHPEIQQRDDGSVDVSTSAGFVPAERHRGRYSGRRFPRRPNYGPGPRGAKPMLDAVLAQKHAPDIQRDFGREVLDERVSEETIQQRAEMMLAVDEGVGRIVAALEECGIADDTMLVFMSDNGSFFGEHGLSIERRFPYEESIRCPLVISHPARVERGRVIDAFALSVDIAPTLLDAAGVDIPRGIQGRSLLPHLAGAPAAGRDAFLVEYHGHENPFPWIANIDYRAVRVGRHKYIRWIREDEAHELYDLEADPFELRNIANEPASAPVVAHAREVMASLVLGSLGLPTTRVL